MKNLKRKNLVLALLVLFALAISGTTYAYWASSVSVTNDTQSESINIGEGQAVTTTVAVTGGAYDGKDLVPTGRVVDSNTQTESIVLVYEVDWTETGTAVDGIAGTLSATVDNIQGDTNGLVNISAVLTDGSAIAVNDASTYTVTVTITMTEPADLAQYNAIVNATITFDVTFAVAVN
jgi:predicted ribosomally synthesized peptide with SipW-like signal peptide